MKNTRRNFFSQLAGSGLALTVPPFFQSLAGHSLLDAINAHWQMDAASMATNEEFWRLIQQAYTASPNVMNLNNGGVSPQPKVVQEAVEHYNRLSNEAPSYYMWHVLDRGREPLRQKLAELAGCSAEEIAINRNSSEALETAIFGIRLQAGDEVVLTKQDYPNMINAWKQRAHRDGIVLKWLDFDFPSEDKSFIVNQFVRAFSARTKVVQITQVINWMGQIMPTREIATEARNRGIDVLVDGAHAFGQLEFNIPDLACDYYGTSLHKWLCAPFGSGLLYVRKEKIKKLYPLFGSQDPESEDIRKFESLGTRSFAIEQAIGHAVNFHNMIGTQRKQKRLHFLKNYWAERVQDLPGVSIGTSLRPEFGGAIGLLKIEGKKPQEVSSYLFDKWKIHTVAIDWENISGVRITPNVYTMQEDLDLLVKAIKTYVNQ